MTDLVEYNPAGPIATTQNLRGLLERQADSLRQILPKHVTPERLMKTMMVAVNRTPGLLKCTQSSVLESVFRAAELGLDVSGTLGEGYLVPFGNQATFIPGYRGLAKLARQTGEVARIEANVVYTADEFEFEQGMDFKLRYRRSLADDRGQKMGVYALVIFNDSGMQAEWMTVADVEKIRSKAQSKNSPAWKDHWDEMAKKTVFRRLAKWLPMSGEKWDTALQADNDDYDLDAIELPEAPSEGAQALQDALTDNGDDSAHGYDSAHGSGWTPETSAPEDGQEDGSAAGNVEAAISPAGEGGDAAAQQSTGEEAPSPASGAAPSEAAMAEAQGMKREELREGIPELERRLVVAGGQVLLPVGFDLQTAKVGELRDRFARLSDALGGVRTQTAVPPMSEAQQQDLPL